MNELDTKATERSGNTNNWFIKKKKKQTNTGNNGHIVNFFKEKKTENTINVGNEKVHKLQLI